MNVSSLKVSYINNGRKLNSSPRYSHEMCLNEVGVFKIVFFEVHIIFLSVWFDLIWYSFMAYQPL